MGIVPKSYQQREQGDENSEIDLTQRRVDMHFVVPVYSYSIQKLMISMALKEMNLDKMVKEINFLDLISVLPTWMIQTKLP